MTAWVLDKEGNRVLAQDECETIVCTLNGSCRNPDILKIGRLIAAAPQLASALSGLLDHYVQLVNSGDAGFWDPEMEQCVIDAREALAKTPSH